jgi:hypothetical protein
MQGGTTAERGLVRAYVRVCGQEVHTSTRMQLLESHAFNL